MKTQINTLQRGHGNKGIIGTSFEVRREIAQAVRAENPSAMKVVVNGIEMELTYAESTTGKSFWYESKALACVIRFNPNSISTEHCVELLESLINSNKQYLQQAGADFNELETVKSSLLMLATIQAKLRAL